MSVDKKALRKDMISKRKSLSKSEVDEKSVAILEQLKSLNLADDKNNIMLYMDFRNEVATQPFIDYLGNMGKKIYIPRVNKDTNELDIYLISSKDDLILSDFGILEPNPDNDTCDPKIIDLILSPGVAFTEECYRLGYGGGFYDKFLTRTRPDVITAALAFDLQMVEELPLEPHDQQLDYVITESKIYCSNCRL